MMTTESKKISTICSESPDLLSRKQAEPAWLEKGRLAYWQAYGEKDTPKAKMDEWRKTLVETIDLPGLSPLAPAHEKTALKAIEAFARNLPNAFARCAGSIYVVDGLVSSAQIEPELSARGVILCSLEEALIKHEGKIKEFLLGDTKPSDSKLALMAGAFFTSGIFLYVPRQLEIERPFLIVNLFSEPKAHQAVFPRVIVVADELSRMDLINVFAGEQAGKTSLTDSPPVKGLGKGQRPWFLSSALVDIHAKSSSTVNYLEVQKLSGETFGVVTNHNTVERDAKFYSLTVGLAGGQIKSDIITHLTARGAAADVYGVALGDGTEHLAYNTVQHHDAPDTTSNINFRVALKGQAVSSYQGNIVVALTASRTDAFQSNKNLLLSSDAKAESIPRLEILTDDVKCSHGATVGPVDKNQVFYLMSRGLDEKEAEELIVSGFFNTVLSTCPIEGAREWIENMVGAKIHASEGKLQKFEPAGKHA